MINTIITHLLSKKLGVILLVILGTYLKVPIPPELYYTVMVYLGGQSAVDGMVGATKFRFLQDPK